MNGAYQIINFDDIEFTTGTAELVVGAYKKITDTAKRFVITHLNLDEKTYKDIQLTFENVEGTFVGTGVVNGKLAVVSIASTDQVTVSLNDIAGDITSLENQISFLTQKTNVINVIDQITINSETATGNVMFAFLIGEILIISGQFTLLENAPNNNVISTGNLISKGRVFYPLTKSVSPYVGGGVLSTENTNYINAFQQSERNVLLNFTIIELVTKEVTP